LYLDPLALSLDLKRDDVKARWFNPEAALVFPQSGPVIFSAMQPPGNKILDAFASSLHAQFSVYRSDGSPAFDVYSVVFPSVSQMKPAGTFDDSIQPLEPSPLDTASGNISHPGGQMMRWTVWYFPRSELPPRLKLFVHLLDQTGQVIASEDRLDVNMASLQPGDLLAQVSTLTLPADLPPGQYPLEAGWYLPETGERLRLRSGEDRLILSRPVIVTLP
jgi:hypothetical protein